MMVADGMVKNGHQAISSHHVVSFVTADYDKLHNSCYAKCIYRATNVKQNILEAGLEVDSPLLPLYSWKGPLITHIMPHANI